MGNQDQTELVKFGPDNYVLVREVVKAALQTKGLSAAISDDTAKRTAFDECKQEQAIGLIKRYIRQVDLPKFSAHEAPFDLWIALRDKFQQTSRTARMVLTQKLAAFQLDYRESLGDYMTRFRTLQMELTNGGLNYGDAHFIIAAINGLPSDYEQFKIVMLNAPDVNTVDELEKRMVNEDLRRDSRDKHAAANSVSSGNRGGGYNSRENYNSGGGPWWRLQYSR